MENQERVEFINQLNDDIKKKFLKLYLKGVFGSKEITKKLIKAKSYNLNIEEIVREELEPKSKNKNYVANLKNHYEVVRKKYRINKKWKDENEKFSAIDKMVEEKFEDMKKFAMWYEKAYLKIENKSNLQCYYCGIDEKNLEDLFEKKLITSKKPSFSGSLQIERLDPDKGYNEENCVLACCICNNAKSDMISAENFKKYFKTPIENFYKDLLKNIKPK
ncbi:hypothetical protein IMC75_05135 [Campylobacter peloridis]|uniref:HNH endonuclease n=1 Tax=Campylobacter peloridis TaxID=488546 RepID=A0ABX6TRK4_9BACT|nr:hypothetical protein [Campylobacter peloridis]AJC84254.1 hypothetical protein CPEL_0389 [Campylobacter peloridis LMG 23910]QOQ88357.1 hypothetical protein IMC75_05135 [Campylobacter peloridis]